jgi:Flp pilus assembly pilin Flp
MIPSPQSPRPVSLFEYAVFFFLVAIVVAIVVWTQGAAIHNVFTNIARAWNS